MKLIRLTPAHFARLGIRGPILTSMLMTTLIGERQRLHMDRALGWLET